MRVGLFGKKDLGQEEELKIRQAERGWMCSWDRVWETQQVIPAGSLWILFYPSGPSAGAEFEDFGRMFSISRCWDGSMKIPALKNTNENTLKGKTFKGKGDGFCFSRGCDGTEGEARPSCAQPTLIISGDQTEEKHPRSRPAHGAARPPLTAWPPLTATARHRAGATARSPPASLRRVPPPRAEHVASPPPFPNSVPPAHAQ